MHSILHICHRLHLSIVYSNRNTQMYLITVSLAMMAFSFAIADNLCGDTNSLKCTRCEVIMSEVKHKAPGNETQMIVSTSQILFTVLLFCRFISPKNARYMRHNATFRASKTMNPSPNYCSKCWICQPISFVWYSTSVRYNR
jgi:hypothetical protein